MATIIDSISLSNFFNFYGSYERNIYEFNEGLNVIVADNMFGKTKLFSAFSWILMDEVIDSDTENGKAAPVESFMHQMISDKAKAEASMDESIRCGVLLKFSDDDFDYEVEKSITGTRVGDGSPTDLKNWDCALNEVTVYKKDKAQFDFVSIFDSQDKTKIINKIIKPEFRQYALLRGEAVDQILDFSNRNSLKVAIDTLANVSKVDTLINLTKYFEKRADKDLQNERKRHLTDERLFESTVKERNQIIKQLSNAEKNLKKDREELVKAKAHRDELLYLVSTATDRQKIRGERNLVEQKLELIDEKHSELLNSLQDRFFDPYSAWLFYKSGHYEENFNKIRDNYIEDQKEKRIISEIRGGDHSFLTKLPEGSPDSYSLRKMLKEEKCFVCGRIASEHSEPWNHIKNVLDSHTQTSNASKSRHKFNSLLDTLMKSASALSARIERVDQHVNSIKLEDKSFREEKRKLRARYEDFKNELLGLGSSREEKDEITINQFEGATRRVERNERNIKDKEKEIVSLSAKLETKNRELESLAGQGLNGIYERQLSILSDINQIANNTRSQLLDEIIEKLEEKSNEYYQLLTESSSVDGGYIRIRRKEDDTFSVELEDEKGNKQYGLSEGYQRMKKLAVIMGIIASKDEGRLEYPLIADAPLSTFGKGLIEGFFRQVPQVFHQSIIMVKDLYDGASSDYLNDIGRDVMHKIKSTSGSLHINLVDKGQPQLDRETLIKRY
ncbi:hypothetical protein [Roseivirga pacifica]|jgi:hypothetical protein